jgi:hypothetical protein
VFAICWLPLNLYHIRADFGTDPFRHNMNVYLMVHWLAMSSVCYNPFIYSIRNSYFRRGIKNFFRFIFCRCDESRNGTSPMRDLSNTQFSSFRCNSTRVKELCETNDEAINKRSLVRNGTKSQSLTLSDRPNKSHKWLQKWKTNENFETQI